jgi:HD-GYP domain-containing protein (c-di-GMP phosphodiesterase class II)
VDGLQEIALMVRHQGERYDGGGYPDGLNGEAIPLGARILAVALRFSAMTKPRAHRRAMSVVGGALEALAQEAGASLDPRVVNAFLATMGRTL